MIWNKNNDKWTKLYFFSVTTILILVELTLLYNSKATFCSVMVKVTVKFMVPSVIKFIIFKIFIFLSKVYGAISHKSYNFQDLYISQQIPQIDMKSTVNILYQIKCEISELRLTLHRQQEVSCISVFAESYFVNKVLISLRKNFYRSFFWKHFVLSKWCTKARRYIYPFKACHFVNFFLKIPEFRITKELWFSHKESETLFSKDRWL